MYIIIVGGREIGYYLARALLDEGHEVLVLDKDAGQVEYICNQLGSICVRGDGCEVATLTDAGTSRADMLIAVTGDDEDNLVACLLTKRMGVGRTFALVDNPALANLIGETAIDAIVSPRLLAIGLTLQHIPGARVHSMAALLGDRVEVMEAEAVKGSRIVSGQLSEVSLPRGVLVVALRRKEALLVPRGTDRVEPGDRVLIIAATDSACASRGPGPR